MTDVKDPIIELIRNIQAMDDSDLARSLRMYLREGIFGETAVYTNLERHRFIAELFNESDTVLQERLRKVFSSVLESFEATNPKDNEEYLFYLVSLASVVRNDQIKERLRRWIRQGTFDTWRHGIFDLNGELVLATSSYDSDDAWVDFTLNVLPKRSSFKNCALAAYRALWLTRGIECLYLIPDMLLVLDLAHEPSSKSMGYLLRLTVDKIGHEQFLKTLIEILGRMQRTASETWIIILGLDQVIEEQLSMQESEMEFLVDALRKLWNETILSWQALPQEPKYEAFDNLLGLPTDLWQNIPIASPRVRAAFIFRKKFILEITEDDDYIREQSEPFFEDISYEEEPVYRVAKASG